MTADNGFAFARSGPSLGGFNVGGEENAGGNIDAGGEVSLDIEPSVAALYCQVSMGDENVTTAAFDIATGEIEIDEVTGPIVVKTEAIINSAD